MDTFPRKEEIRSSGPAIRSHTENDLKCSHLGDFDDSLAMMPDDKCCCHLHPSFFFSFQPIFMDGCQAVSSVLFIDHSV